MTGSPECLGGLGRECQRFVFLRKPHVCLTPYLLSDQEDQYTLELAYFLTMLL